MMMQTNMQMKLNFNTQYSATACLPATFILLQVGSCELSVHKWM